MKKIVILDTSINNTNLGNQIICEAINQNLKRLFPHDFFYHLPVLEQLNNIGQTKIKEADYVFVAGTNIIRSDMEQNTQWNVNLQEKFWNSKVILMGVGWWQYQDFYPNAYTNLLLDNLMSHSCYHSVRDSYTANKLEKLGFKVINTGCPTMWSLTPEHCGQIPPYKADKVVLTFTEYNFKPEYDKLLFDILAKNYSVIYFWTQMYCDYSYAKQICGDKVKYIAPSVEALDQVLISENVDYVGTRLHAGIRALQHKRRTIIIGIDNRAIEKAKDFNLTVISRQDMQLDLEHKINSNWNTRINLNWQNIQEWKNQFLEKNVLFEHKLNHSYNYSLSEIVEAINNKQNDEGLNKIFQFKQRFSHIRSVYYGEAIALLRIGKAQEAIEHLNDLLRLYPNHKKSKILLNEIYLGLLQGNKSSINYKKLLNLGCGSHFNSDWTNVDFISTGEGIIAHNLRQGIPFADRTFDVVYHSHVLEHFPKNEAEFFLQECYRVLESQGIIRVVIPDLEQIARLYLQSLENALQGSQEDVDNYDWIMLEMYDQVVRNESGGEMKKYLAQNPLPNEQFIIERLGVEGEQLIKMLRGKNFPNSQLNPTQIGYFRESGEIHQWMYDRFSLSRLLTKVGFVDIKVCQANESRIPNFNSYYLDVLPDGRVRKSDSLFMEGIKP